MAIEVYSTDADLVKIRSNILLLGETSWEEKHKEAFSIINRVIIGRWYQKAAAEYSIDWRQTEFSPDLVETGTLTMLSSYKTLELIYLLLMKDSPQEDAFERQHHLFRRLYREEMNEVLAIGISYDWDGDGEIVAEEHYQRVSRTLVRI